MNSPDVLLSTEPASERSQPLDDSTTLILAPAKINLNLLVGPRRDDGFHPIDSLTAKVSWYDRIELTARDDGEIRFVCEGADCGADEDNLAFRAARLLAGAADEAAHGAEITLRKAIPPGKGLGGGSSDAAAVLLGLNELWELHLPPERLGELAANLGSDVPLFLGPPAMRMTGRGEKLQPVAIHPFCAILITPPCLCMTAEVYQAFDEQPQQMQPQLDPGLLSQPPSRWRGRLENQLAPAAIGLCRELEETWTRLAGAIELPLLLTGSGSAMFVLCDDQREAARVFGHIPADLRQLCRLVRRNPW